MRSTDSRSVGRRIAEHRISEGLSPEQFGLRIGVSGVTVRRVERGYKPFLSTQKRFADALGVPVLELWPFENEEVDQQLLAIHRQRARVMASVFAGEV